MQALQHKYAWLNIHICGAVHVVANVKLNILGVKSGCGMAKDVVVYHHRYVRQNGIQWTTAKVDQLSEEHR